MNPLRLNKLNVRSAYSVWDAGKQSYGFKTDYGVLYRVVFADDQTIWENCAYEFCILNENERVSPGDAKVKDTIIAIIQEFFAVNPYILLYQCETGDNRQSARGRLFLRWFQQSGKESEYQVRVCEIIAEGIPNYAAIIVQKSNPRLKTIMRDFDEFVTFFREKPQIPE